MTGAIIALSVFLGIIGFLMYRSSFSGQRSARVYVYN